MLEPTMKPLPSLLLLFLTIATPCLADRTADEAAVIQLLHAACEAFRVGNVDYLNAALEERFTLTDSRGAVTTKEQELAAVRNGDPKYDVFRNSDMKVRLYGDTALVNGITTVQGTSAGKPFRAELQFTDTLIKRNGEWRLAASHASPLIK
jgi:hypothetical protein